MKTLAECQAFAAAAGLRVVPAQDQKRDRTFVDVYLVYRGHAKEGKSRSLKGLATLLTRLAPHVVAPAPAAVTESRPLGTPLKHWWEKD